VGRSPVAIRTVAAHEIDSLAELWNELLAQEHTTLVVPGSLDIAERVRERVLASEDAVAAGRRPTFRVIVADVEGVPVGFASLSVVDRGLLSSTAAVVVDVVHVSGKHRKHGVGTALLREAAGFADEVGAGDVVVNVPPTHRDVNRFFARYGFAPMVVRRSAPIGQLRRRLGVDPRLDVRDTTIDLTPTQRSLRRRVLLTPRRAVRP
jgi:GNAT superfamily N-acetyltransferase